MKRSGKFYYRNEKEVLSKLGLTPAPQSGAGWIIKEDGENDLVLAQLKSTDKSSYRIEMLDIKKLEYHSQVSNKVPVFLIQFLEQNKIYALVDIQNIPDLYKAFELEEAPERTIELKEPKLTSNKTIKHSKEAREEFFKDSGEVRKRKWKHQR